MTYRSWEARDPLEVLIRRGEDCTHCRHLERWNVAGRLVTQCGNPQAPATLRKSAPAKRCDMWQHEKQDGGQ